MAAIALDLVALEQLHGEQKALLDTIDDLRKHGVGEFVDLPQIIVVGDQSSGKSSVLEAISRVRFPVKDGLCTRFATELVLRTDPRTKIDVAIQPSSSASDKVKSFNETRFDKDELPSIIERAKKSMLQDDTGFSEDVLRVEISGPDVPHLTLVDLPGFYHSEDENQSAAGREVVDRLVERYMSRKNSIILAIISAQNQLIMQKVLSRVNQHDKNRDRTLGIITKPDMLKPGSQAEENFVRLAKNLEKSHELSLGWHILRNRDETERNDSDKERDAKEKEFFQATPWVSVPSKNRGIDVLRRKLSTILHSHIKSHIQSLIDDIEFNISERHTQLKRLGESRSTPKELRSYLDKIASQFQILSMNAIDGNYSDGFFGGLFPENRDIGWYDSRVRKLRALVRDLNRAFAYVLATKGSKRIILPRGISCEEEEEDEEDEDEDAEEVGQKTALPRFLKTLADQYSFSEPERVTFERAVSGLELNSSANQGNEFPGTSNDRIAVELFRDQSEPWEAIGRAHIQFMLSTCQTFVEKLLGHVAEPDKKTRLSILNEIIDPFFENKKIVLENKLQELLYHYRRGNPQPLDLEFRTLLAKRHQKNMTTELLQHLVNTQPELFTEKGLEKLRREAKPSQTTEFDIEGLIDKSEVYYEVSLRTFTENVIVLAIENCLIKDLPHIFTTEKVNQMDDEELKRLAAESEEIRVERSELQEQYDSLKKGLQLCNKYRERKALFTSPILVEIDGITIRPKPGADVPDDVATYAPLDRAFRQAHTSLDKLPETNKNTGDVSAKETGKKAAERAPKESRKQPDAPVQTAHESIPTVPKPTSFFASTTPGSNNSPQASSSFAGPSLVPTAGSGNTQKVEGGLFGVGRPSGSSASGSTLFGSPAAKSGGGLFGSPAVNSGGGLFGSPAVNSGGGAFGSPAVYSGGGAFGSPAVNSGGGLFGSPAAQSGGGLFSGRPLEQSSTGFGSSIYGKTASNSTPSAFGSGIDLAELIAEAKKTGSFAQYSGSNTPFGQLNSTQKAPVASSWGSSSSLVGDSGSQAKKAAQSDQSSTNAEAEKRAQQYGPYPVPLPRLPIVEKDFVPVQVTNRTNPAEAYLGQSICFDTRYQNFSPEELRYFSSFSAT